MHKRLVSLFSILVLVSMLVPSNGLILAREAQEPVAPPQAAAPESTPAQATNPQGAEPTPFVPLSQLIRVDAESGQPAPLDPDLLNHDGPVSVVIELEAAPAAVAYAEALQASGEMARAGTASRNRVAQIEAAQQALLAPLADMGAQVIYRVQRVYNGIAVTVDAAQLAKMAQLPGVKAIHRLVTKTLDHTTSVPLIGAPEVWNASGLDATGEGVDIAIIDSGIDYVHTDFGGPGTEAAYEANNTITTSDTYNGAPLFPTLKVAGGWDFAGDAYDGDTVPQPDPDPAACLTGGESADHGTHVAGSAAGYGVNQDGTTYTGTYSSAIDFSQFRIGPGVAPKARLYALRVFGCNGGTNLTDAAIEWAVDPDGNGDLSDHMDVINMSLGSDYGTQYDSSAVASDNAVLAGVIVVASAGNANDNHYIVGSPSTGDRVISVASSRDSSDMLDGFRVNAPAALAGLYPASFSVAYPWVTTTTLPITGTLVYPDPGNNPAQDQRTGCYTFDITNTQKITGNIVLLDWTTPSCGGSVARTGKAFAAGARGVILVDDATIFGLRITGSSVIPSVSAPKSVGEMLKAHIGENISITFDDAYGSNVLLVDPVMVDTMSTFSSRGPRRGDSALKPDVAAPGDSIFSAYNGTGNQGLNYGGTSMASPHVAGAMALLKELHPTWSVEELKALLMNTAVHDTHTDPPADPVDYSPARIGAGRVDLAQAGSSDVVAYVANGNGLVSVSFGAPEVAANAFYTATRAIQVTNKGAQAVTYAVRYAPRADMPGVQYSLSKSLLTVPANGTATFSVTMVVNAAEIDHTADPALALDGYRYWMNEESGYIELSDAIYRTYLPMVFRNAGTTVAANSERSDSASAAPEPEKVLRIPVYAAPRQVSAMEAVQTGLDFSGLTSLTGTATISLTGLGIDTGPEYPFDRLSLVSAFELQETNPNDPESTGVVDAADLRYIGVTNDYALAGTVNNTVLYFALSTYGKHASPSYMESEFDVFIDNNDDGEPEYAIYNGQFGAPNNPTDEFYTVLVDLVNGVAYDISDFSINGVPAYAYDTAEFNTDVLVLAVPATYVDLTDANPRFNYWVQTYNRDADGLVDISELHTFTAGQPGLSFTAGAPDFPVRADLPGATIPVTFQRAAYAANESQGVLLLHYLNGDGARAEVLTVTAPTSNLAYVTLLHTNDFHGNLELSGSNPGVARMARVINQVRGQMDPGNVVLIDAGDEMQGSLLSNLQKGKPTIDLFNFLGYDAATFGNHEFDWGQQVLISRTLQADYPFLAANLVVNDSGNCATAGWTSPSFARPWITMTVGTPGNEVVLGLIGVTSQETPFITSASATEGLCFKDAAQSVVHYYDAVRAAGAQAIVIVSHLGNTDGGYGYGIAVYGDQTLARKLVEAGKPANLIIGGHSHTDLSAAQTISGTTVVQAHYAGRKVGRADLVVNKTTGAVTVNWQRLTVSPSGAQDPAIASRLSTWANDPAYQALINQVIGFTNVDLVRNYNGDSTMGAFINDAIYNDLNTDGTVANDVDMVFNNPGGLRADITSAAKPLTLTYGLLFSVLPFGNQTIVGDMTGAQIQDLLNQSATLFKGSLQVSGIRFHFYNYTDTLPSQYNPLPWAWGAYSITIRNRTTDLWEPLVMTKTYHVATNEFLAPAGQDGFTPFKYMTNISYWGDMLDSVNRWVANSYGTPATAYNAGLDGRIVQDSNIIPVTILHHNDPHGRLLDSGTAPGYTRLASLIRQEWAHNPSRTILLNAGDTIQGDAMMAYYKAAFTGFGPDGSTIPVTLTTNPILAAMNAMTYTAMTLGNHEYNFGSYIFTGTLGQANFPLLQANVYDDGRYGLDPLVDPDLSVSLPGPNGAIKVAILGLGNHRVPQYELPSNIPGLTFTNPITEAQARVPALEAANDAVVAMTHIGFTTEPGSLEVDTNVDTELAKVTGGIDAIIGSHSHTDPTKGTAPYKYLPAIVGDPDNAPVIINQAYRYNTYLGEVVLGLLPKAGGGYEVVARAGRAIPNSTTIAEDPAIKAIVDPYNAHFATYKNTVLGSTTVPLDALDAFIAETNAANLQADASKWKLTQVLTTPVDFHLSGAMTNARVAATATVTSPAVLTINDMFSLMPYENSLVVMRMNGPQLKAVLERAYRNYWYYKYQDNATPRWGGYSHYTTCMLDISAGGTITYDEDPITYTTGTSYVLGLSFGSTVVNFTDPNTYYNVSTVNYLAAGSCNFNDSGVSLWPISNIIADTQYYVRDVVIEYIPTLAQPIAPAVQGRIIFQ